MFAAILMLCGASLLASCNSTAGNHANDAEQADTVKVQSDTYEAAIERFLIDSIGSHYGSGDVCIPCTSSWVLTVLTSTISKFGVPIGYIVIT